MAHIERDHFKLDNNTKYIYHIIRLRNSKPIHFYVHIQSSRVISSPLAISVHHIDERSRKATVSLLARVQRIIPEVRVWVCSSNTISAICSAVIDIASYSRIGAIQVLRGVVVHVGDLLHSSAFFALSAVE